MKRSHLKRRQLRNEHKSFEKESGGSLTRKVLPLSYKMSQKFISSPFYPLAEMHSNIFVQPCIISYTQLKFSSEREKKWITQLKTCFQKCKFFFVSLSLSLKNAQVIPSCLQMSSVGGVKHKVKSSPSMNISVRSHPILQ